MTRSLFRMDVPTIRGAAWLNFKFLVFLAIVAQLCGCSPMNHWDLTDGPGLKSSPDIAGYKIGGNIFVAATNKLGIVVYSQTSQPGLWTRWESVAPPPKGGFEINTSPVLVSTPENRELRVYARGVDNNLYRAIKIANSQWSSWEQVIGDGNVAGRFSVAMTWRNPQSTPEEHIVYVSKHSCQYHRITSGSGHVKSAWTGCLEAVITGDGENEVGVILRFDDRMEFETIRRTDGFVSTSLLKTVSGPTALQILSNWKSYPLRTLYRKIFSLSSLVRFEDSYHIVFADREITDDVGPRYSFSLMHAWFDSRTGNFQTREVAKYQPIQDKHALPDLALYRNKLLSIWTSPNGGIRSARWDNADPDLPWITYGNAGNGEGQFRPAITSFNRRPYVFVTGEEQYNDLVAGEPQYGDDAYAVISGKRENGRPEFIIISRAMMRKDMAKELTLYNSRSDNLKPPCRKPSDKFGPQRITNLWSDDRMVLTEIGFNLWAFPNWLVQDLYSDFTIWMCTSPDGDWQNGQTPCHTSRLPVYIQVSGDLFNCGGAWINRDNSYIEVWEEMGHYFAPALGFGTNMTPTQASADRTGISLATLNAGRQLFLVVKENCTAPSPRCAGFIGNYENGAVEHSFIYNVYFYMTKGDQLRELIAEDLAIGNDLLLRKYNWIKDNIFRGIEYRDNLEPL